MTEEQAKEIIAEYSEQLNTGLLPGAPLLTSATVSGTSVVLAWRQDNAVPAGGYDIFIDGVDTNEQYRTTLLTATIPDLDLSVSHCLAIQARYTDTNQFLLSNTLCTEATATNTAPSINGTPATSVVEGKLYSFTPTASDADSDSLTFSISEKPAWASLYASTGTLSGTPTTTDIGIHSNIVISVSDGIDTVALAPFSITVEEAVTELLPGAPVLTSASVSGTSVVLAWRQDNAVPTGGYDVVIDGDDPGTYRTTLLTATIPDVDASISHCFMIEARYTDTSQFLRSNQLCTQTVIPDNTAPTISGNPPTSVSEDEFYNFTPTASDPNGDNLTFSISGKPAWTSFNTTNGALAGTPGYDDAGNYDNIKITVTDGKASTSLSPFSINVANTNRTTSISGTPATSVIESESYRFTPTASDPDSDNLTFSISGKPAWASFNTINGTLSGTPGYSDAGTYDNIVITVSDGSNNASLNPFSINVQDTNRAPSIGGTPATSVAEGEAYAFIPSVTDPDGDSLTFSISGKPAWSSFNSTNGSLTGTPGSNDASTYSNIVISVSDGTDTVALAPFSITVEAPASELLPGAPVLTSATVSDTSVVLAWRQDNAVPEGGYDIFIDVVDTNEQYRTTLLTATIAGMDTSVAHCFAIQARYTDTSQFLLSNELCTQAVIPDNTAPTISGNPPTFVTENEFYSFTPTASDPDGDNLTFSVSGLPAWASFNTTNGILSGIPETADFGIYEDITITVSDGTASSSLGPFSINVVTVSDPSGSAQLSWQAPTTRTDNNPLDLSGIKGYRIYMGTTSENLSMIADQEGGSATDYLVKDLDVGSNYCFAVTVYDTQENESGYSNIICKEIL